MTDLVTVTLDQLPQANAVSPKTLTLVQEPGGPAQAIPIRSLLGRLISTNEATETEADLQALLDYAPPAIALVFADPDPTKSGWYLKVGASGAGNWAQFEQLYSATVINDFDARIETTEAALARLTAPIVTAFAANPSLIELGSAADVALAWQVSTAPAAQRLDGVAIAAGDRAAVAHGPWNADRTVELDLDDASTPPNTHGASVTIGARAPVFAGIAAEAPNDAAILASPYKALDSDHIARGLALDRSAGGRPYFIYPAALTITSIALGGFALGGWAESAPANLTLATGAVVSVKRVVLDPVAASTDPLEVTLA